jgi:hypothetical protein
MNAFNDSLTIGLVFFLIISAVSIYFYTRLQEFENKIEMTEGMLFDIKQTLEFMHYVGSTEGSFASPLGSPLGSPLSSSSASGSASGLSSGSGSASPLTSLQDPDKGAEVKVDTEEQPVSSSPLIPLLVPFAEDDDRSVKSELSASSSTGKPQSDINNLLSLNVNELRKLAKTKQVVNYRKLTKKELIEQLSGRSKEVETEGIAEGTTGGSIEEAEEV